MTQPRAVPQGADSQAYAPLYVLGAPGGTLGIGNATISTGEVLLRAASQKRRSITIQNKHATNKLSIGPTGVTMSNSIVIDPNGDITLDRSAGAPIYVIADAAGTDVRWIEELND